MKSIAVSEFKAKCLSILHQVQKTRKPVLITRFGKPLAEVNPPSPQTAERSWLGCMEGKIKFLGDIVSPVFEESDWKELNE